MQGSNRFVATLSFDKKKAFQKNNKQQETEKQMKKTTPKWKQIGFEKGGVSGRGLQQKTKKKQGKRKPKKNNKK